MQRNRLELRAFYDHQIKAKREQQQNERDADKKLGQQIKEKVQRIDKLTSLNEHVRLMKRGTVALENLGANNVKRNQELQQKQIANQQTRQQQALGDRETTERNLIKKDIETRRKKEYLEAIKN